MNVLKSSMASTALPAVLCAAALLHGLSISGVWLGKTLGEMSGPYLVAGVLWTLSWFLVWPLLAMGRIVRWPCVALSLLVMALSLLFAFIATLVTMGART